MVLSPLLPTCGGRPRKRKPSREAAAPPEPRTWLLLDPLLERHSHPLRRHSECPRRITCIFDAIREAGLAERCRVVECEAEASDEALGRVHSAHYLTRLRSLRRAGPERLCDEAEQYDDVYLNEHSIACARLAAGGVLRMADALWAGSMQRGFALVRPAGHHAGPSGPSGFCLLNNLAVAARQLLAQGCQRVLIVDWDVHHGDGTQQAFLDEERVLFFSVHRRGHNIFPFKGRAAAAPTAVGTGRGAGFSVNVAWEAPGMADAEYAHAWSRVLLPLIRAWRPEAVLVSAGFDAARGDPLADCAVTAAGFGAMTRGLLRECGGRLLLALEGGYSLKQLPQCALACVRALLGEPPTAAEAAAAAAADDACDAAREAVAATLQAHAPYWPDLAAHEHASAPPQPEQPQQQNTPEAMASVAEEAAMAVELPPAAATRLASPVPVRFADVSALRDFSDHLPADFRSGYLAWRSGKPRGAKGEPQGTGGGTGGTGTGTGGGTGGGTRITDVARSLQAALLPVLPAPPLQRAASLRVTAR